MEKRAAAHWRDYVGWGVLLAIPIVVLFTILIRTAVDLPILDDYPNVLGTAGALSQAHSLAARVAIVLHREHNGYKLMFENAVVWAQYALLGKVSMLPLVLVGNALAIVIFLAVAAMLRRDTVRSVEWLALLLPVAFLDLQLQYASALNFASSSLQHLAVLAFAMWAIYGLCGGGRGAFIAACLATALSVGSSPNGFFLAPVGCLIMLQRRQWRRLGCWAIFFAVLLGNLPVPLRRGRVFRPCGGQYAAAGIASGKCALCYLVPRSVSSALYVRGAEPAARIAAARHLDLGGVAALFSRESRSLLFGDIHRD